MLENRDYTIIIDRSGSMSTLDQPGDKSRWAVLQESTLALARQCEEFDPDGRFICFHTTLNATQTSPPPTSSKFFRKMNRRGAPT